MNRMLWIFNSDCGRYETYLDGKLYFVADTAAEFFDGWKMLTASA